MGMTKKLLEDILEEDFYPSDLDYMEMKSAYEEMLADKY
jgi:hypothetical protein